MQYELMTDEEYAAFLLRWIAALRSGSYDQATGQLRTSTPEGEKSCCCCLGVLCDLLPDIFTWKSPYVDDTVVAGRRVLFIDNTDVLPSDFTQSRLGWMTDHGAAGELGELKDLQRIVRPIVGKAVWTKFMSSKPPRVSLAHLNDAGATFAQIADIIERAPFIGGRKNPLPTALEGPTDAD